MADYEQYHHDKDALQKCATNLGNIDVNPVSDLEQIRVLINKYCEDLPDSPKLSPDWCFVDCKSSTTQGSNTNPNPPYSLFQTVLLNDAFASIVLKKIYTM